jgi:sugar phosphate isomerase/epimerase
MTTVLDRCARLGIKTLVFGSGGARRVPDGFDPARARGQIVDFLKLIAPMLQQRGIVLVVEHLNRNETNIILSVEEAMTYVRELNHPNIKCLLDTYHFWLNQERMDSIAPALPWIKHVHVSDVDRHPPKNGDYRSIFAILKKGGYEGPISVEAINFDIERDGPRVLAFLKDEWSKA